MMRGSNIHYELSDKTRATVYGGMGAVHRMVQRLGWVEPIDQNLELLKVHLPCHESDHVRNIAGNVLVGGERLEDIELRRPDESFLDGVGAQRIPDPTTAGDFTRRFGVEQLTELQECINRTRPRVWEKPPMEFRRFLHAIILLPVQIIRAGRKIMYRGLSCNGWRKDFLATFKRLSALEAG